ncbi:hypothetical protein Tco_1046387 [Tanacetum coccineum]
MEPLDVLAQIALARDVEYDHILNDDFGTVTRGEEIELTLFPLTLASYQMSYQYEGAPLTSALDPDVCRKYLDRTITPAELKRTESLLPLDLSNRFNVLSALLVSHGAELNSRYTGLVTSKLHLKEKLDQKREDVNFLRREVTSLDKKLKDLQKEFYALGQENRDLHSQRDVTSNKTDAKLSEQALVVRDLQNELASEKAQSQRLLSSDEFHAALAHVASLGINYSFERGLRMGCTNDEFEAVAQKISNFHVGAKAAFDKALVEFPITSFLFLSKIAAEPIGSLSEVTQVLPNKFTRPSFAAPSTANEASPQV